MNDKRTKINNYVYMYINLTYFQIDGTEAGRITNTREQFGDNAAPFEAFWLNIGGSDIAFGSGGEVGMNTLLTGTTTNTNLLKVLARKE